jgi:lipoate-protein ligase A
MALRVIQTGVSHPELDMQADMEALQNLTYGEDVVLHLYRWEACATYGVLTQPSEWIDVENLSIPFFQRPTGGGILFHVYDLPFGVILPATHPAFVLPTMEKYHLINGAVVQAVRNFVQNSEISLNPRCCDAEKAVTRFCLAHSTHYDLVVNGLKVGGAAQRKIKTGFLHQGSITLHLPPKELLHRSLLQRWGHLADAMHSASVSLLPEPPKDSEKKALGDSLIASLASTL